MPEFTKSDHDMITEMHSVLLGVNGHDGLCTEFSNHKVKDEKFREDYYKFKRLAIGIFCFLAGTGALGTSAWGISKLLGG